MSDRTCNVPKCNRPHSALGMCNLHYQRSLHGKPLEQKPKPIHAACTIEGCEKAPRSKYATLCAMHYHRIYRYGTISPQHPPRYTDLTGHAQGELTVKHRGDGGWMCDCSCGASVLILTGDWNRGQTTCGNRSTHWRQDDVGYWGAHQRLEADRGRASSHPCVDCGTAAAHWSYSNAGADERRDERSGLAYSLDQDDYEPRCAACHGRFDARAA